MIKVAEDEDGPGFAYSVGLFQSFGHPEIIIFGLSLELMHRLINDLGQMIRAGERFDDHSSSSDPLEGYRIRFRQVAPGARDYYFGAAVRFYGDEEFPSLHCIWPDRLGRYPWDTEANDAYRRLQPMLTDGPEASTAERPSAT